MSILLRWCFSYHEKISGYLFVLLHISSLECQKFSMLVNLCGKTCKLPFLCPLVDPFKGGSLIKGVTM